MHGFNVIELICNQNSRCAFLNVIMVFCNLLPSILMYKYSDFRNSCHLRFYFSELYKENLLLSRIRSMRNAVLKLIFSDLNFVI